MTEDEPMKRSTHGLAVVTGASSGIGFELAKIAAENGFDLVIAADEPQIEDAANELRAFGGGVRAIEVDLATPEGVEDLDELLRSGPDVDALFANAGRGLGKAFLDQTFEDWCHVIDTNITGTLYLIQKVGGRMRARRSGKILITGSIAGYMPGSFQAVYNGSKAFIDSFAFALREELKDSGVSVTCLMPGATETNFFKRADMLDTKVATDKKDDPAAVAKTGFDAMMSGEGGVVSGWKNKVQSTLANVTPAETLAEQHRKMAAPGSGKQTIPK
jgi:short-subunit dehydrogenase